MSQDVIRSHCPHCGGRLLNDVDDSLCIACSRRFPIERNTVPESENIVSVVKTRFPTAETHISVAEKPKRISGKDCAKCRTYKNCPGKVWYTYSDIRWCPQQVIWILLNSNTFLVGNWPAHPDVSSYIDPLVKTGYRSEAYYTKPEEIIGEVERRLKYTGVDGKLLRAEIKNGVEIGEFEPESWSALMYIKGKDCKRMSYKDWQRQRNYRQRN